MGEQSVGKSFTLNHLVDTSFAGSAMRTTEGVWMSVTPTKEALIVALDFEGTSVVEFVLGNPCSYHLCRRPQYRALIPGRYPSRSL